MLTDPQAKALRVIDDHQRDSKGVSPSFQEIGCKLDINSLSHVSYILNGLEERGMIKRIPQRARAIHITNTGRNFLHPRCPRCGRGAA